MALKAGMDDGEYQKVLDNVLGQPQSDSAAATDRHRRARDAGPLDGHGVPGDADDDDTDEDAVAERVRQILRAQGWTDEKIETELAKRRGEEGAEDVIPHNALGGRLHARTGSGTIRPHDEDPGVAYPGLENVLDLADYSPDPARLSPSYNPATGRDPRDRTRERGEQLGSKLPGSGVTRRLSNDSVFDEQLQGWIDAVKVGVFG